MRLRDDKLLFTIGYSSSDALINKKIWKSCRRMSPLQLFEKGLLLQACRKALKEDDQLVLDKLIALLQISCSKEEQALRLTQVFGLSSDHKNINGIIEV